MIPERIPDLVFYLMVYNFERNRSREMGGGGEKKRRGMLHDKVR